MCMDLDLKAVFEENEWSMNRKSSKLTPLILKVSLRGRGSTGDLIQVKNGYANYLVVSGKAIIANKANMEIMDQQKAEWVEVDAKKRAEGKVLKDKIDQVVIDIEHNTVDGFRLYGSISSKDIMNQLENRGFKIRKEDIVMKPIKEIGTFNAHVYTYGNQANIIINVKAPVVAS